MTEALLNLLKQALAGDDNALQSIVLYGKEQKISVADQEKMHVYLKQAAEQNAHALYIRALLMDEGLGVGKNDEMVFLIMREAAAKGDSRSIYEVGHRFLEGKGVGINYNNALQWLTLAADSPHYIQQAMFDLGRMHENGLGVPVDLKQAVNWYQKASNKGHQMASDRLALLQNRNASI